MFNGISFCWFTLCCADSYHIVFTLFLPGLNLSFTSSSSLNFLSLPEGCILKFTSFNNRLNQYVSSVNILILPILQDGGVLFSHHIHIAQVICMMSSANILFGLMSNTSQYIGMEPSIYNIIYSGCISNSIYNGSFPSWIISTNIPRYENVYTSKGVNIINLGEGILPKQINFTQQPMF